LLEVVLVENFATLARRIDRRLFTFSSQFWRLARGEVKREINASDEQPFLRSQPDGADLSKDFRAVNSLAPDVGEQQ
jgi:hypothetical protein